jgi:hydrogenase-4 component E
VILVELLLVLIALSNLMLVGSGRIAACINLAAAQGVALSLLPLLVTTDGIGLLLALSFWVTSRFTIPRPMPSPLALPLALSTMLTGLFVIVSRFNALNQVVGFLVLENGVYMFGLLLAPEVPFLVEMGILLDVFVAVFVMGITIFHISREFEHIDVEQLTTLRD